MIKEIVQPIPRSLQLWERIEEEAQERAQKRFEEILKKERESAAQVPTDAAEGHYGFNIPSA